MQHTHSCIQCGPGARGVVGGGGGGGPEPIQALIRQDGTQDRSPMHHRANLQGKAHIHTYGQSLLLTQPPSAGLWTVGGSQCTRKPTEKDPEQTGIRTGNLLAQVD